MNRTIKGALTTGVEFNGKFQKDFEIRIGTIGDLVALLETPAGERAAKNFIFQQVALNALRLVKLGDIPKAQITPELLLELTEQDMNTLSAAARQTADRGDQFQGEKGEVEVNPSPVKARV
jgi:hypothetical protein